MKTINLILKCSFLIFLSSYFISCESNDNNSESEIIEETEEETEEETTVYWTGDSITFTKAADTDASLEANQDRITDDVWLTRSSGGGKFYNAAVETHANFGTAPTGLKIAKGTVEDVQNGTITLEEDFGLFQAIINKPKNNTNIDLVVYIEADDTYFDFKILSWADGGGQNNSSSGGGFSIQRSTPASE